VKKWIALIVVVVVAAGAYIAADTYLFQKKHEPSSPGEKVRIIQRDEGGPQADASQQQVPVQRPATIIEIPVPLKESEKSFAELKAELAAICSEIERKDYMKAYDLQGGLLKHLDALIEKLAYRPPVVSGETQDLYSLLSNAAHFYRVLGKNDIMMFKDILSHERSRVEPLMALTFHYLVKGSAGHKLNVNSGQLYEYAGFFLNTLGGQSYLYRRDSVTRTLTKYYSVLILDMANRETMNPYGIDIRPHLTLIQEDLRNLGTLKNSDEYLARLKEIESLVLR
jgi:hypothetical protein